MQRKYEVWIRVYDPTKYQSYVTRVDKRYDRKEQAEFVVLELKRGTTIAIKTREGKWIDRSNILDMSVEVCYC